MKERDDVIQSLMNPSHNQIEKLNTEIRRLEREVDTYKSRLSTLTAKLDKAKIEAASSSANTEFIVKRATEALEVKIEELVEELDDLKYNYKDALRQNIKFEEKIKQLTSQESSGYASSSRR